MPASPARLISYDVLLRVATQASYADDLLRAELGPSITHEDAGLATELTQGVLRWQRLLDAIIDRNLIAASRPLDIEVRIALRLGIYQLYFLSRIPAHAAVHESVELAKRARKRSAAPLVNAVLRKSAKAAAAHADFPAAFESLVPPGVSMAERFGLLYSHPTWLVERWLGIFGEQHTQDLLCANNRVPAVSCHVLDEAHRDDAHASLTRSGCAVGPGVLLRDAWSWHGGNPAACEAVTRGWVAVQDEASQAVAHILDVQPGQLVLDLCAAPGGKTQILARAVGATGRVVAVDLHGRRARMMEERFARAGWKNIEVVTLDATHPLPFQRPFDRILVDAPCSGTGTLARHPEIRWRVKPSDLADLHQRQVSLLRNALRHLAPNGRLVYSTCALEPEENEAVVHEVIGSASTGASRWRVYPPHAALRAILRPGILENSLLDAAGFVRTFPPEHATDGFFGAVIGLDG